MGTGTREGLIAAALGIMAGCADTAGVDTAGSEHDQGTMIEPTLLAVIDTVKGTDGELISTIWDSQTDETWTAPLQPRVELLVERETGHAEFAGGIDVSIIRAGGWVEALPGFDYETWGERTVPERLMEPVHTDPCPERCRMIRVRCWCEVYTSYGECYEEVCEYRRDCTS